MALFKSEEGRQRPEEGLGSIQPVEVQDERFERSFSYPVSVPAPIVGLLLSVRYTAINFIATVGKATYTFISSPKRSKEKDEENGSSTDAELIVFTVAGKNSHNVALAASFLLRVVQGERIKDVLVSVLSCQPQPTGSSGRGHSEAEGTGKGKPKFIDGSSLKSGAISKPADEKSTAVVPGPEQDEEEINAQLFSAPSDVASGGVPRRGGRSRGGRGRSSKGSGNRPSK